MTDTTTPLSADDEAALDRYARSIASSFGFARARVREALDAIAPSTDKSSVVNWLLDHGEEDKGGAVELARASPFLAHPDSFDVPPSHKRQTWFLPGMTLIPLSSIRVCVSLPELLSLVRSIC